MIAPKIRVIGDRCVTGVEFSTKGGVDDIRYAAPGMAGEVRVLYSPVLVIPGSTLIIKPTRTLWWAVDAKADFTRQFKLTGLVEGITYKVVVEGCELQIGEEFDLDDQIEVVPYPAWDSKDNVNDYHYTFGYSKTVGGWILLQIDFGSCVTTFVVLKVISYRQK